MSVLVKDPQRDDKVCELTLINKLWSQCPKVCCPPICVPCPSPCSPCPKPCPPPCPRPCTVSCPSKITVTCKPALVPCKMIQGGFVWNGVAPVCFVEPCSTVCCTTYCPSCD
ncbi:hypothetical protein QAD02_000636 [Eretmocerus hayati]|uniref:Uncharacterized protein n=1 Tax=Eretmocerus hayati TaxID=131215 RepID=A0ACC2NDY9_9HYME|nr:hypothetical protein QAD02_000636 [Eretmocerus hayati]